MKSILPHLETKSRIERSVANRSHQMLNKMAEFSRMSELSDPSDKKVRRPKLKQSVQDIIADGDSKKNIEPKCDR